MLLKFMIKWVLVIVLFFGGFGMGMQANVIENDLMGTFATFLIYMGLLCMCIKIKE